MDDGTKYRSKELYTARKISSMGSTQVEVKNGYGMVSAILSEEDFATQFEVIPASS